MHVYSACGSGGPCDVCGVVQCCVMEVAAGMGVSVMHLHRILLPRGYSQLCIHIAVCVMAFMVIPHWDSVVHLFWTAQQCSQSDCDYIYALVVCNMYVEADTSDISVQ